MFERFRRSLSEQRWDDHRYYHQSRINQSLHFISAVSFLVAYGLLFIDPAAAALVGWGVSMVTRQSGHFFFEPRGFDTVNQVSDAHKEAVKVGYNMRRKTLLLAVWAALPALLWWQPSLFGLITPAADRAGWLHDVGIAWLALALGGMLVRIVQLTLQQSAYTALVWTVKILTDPLHDIMLYWQSPLWLARGQLLDPMAEVRASHARH